MHPPVSACEAVYAIHPQLRIAWAGRERKFPEEENPGSFALVQLYHISDVGQIGDTNTFRELWDVTVWYSDYGKADIIRANRGPIFNRYGGTDRDWDPLFRIPVFVATLDEAYGLKIEDVYSGKFIVDVKRWMRPYYQRFEESSKAKAADYRRRMDDMGNSATDYLWHKASKTGEAYAQNWTDTPTETRNMKRKRNGELEPENWLLPKQAPKFKRRG
jgi:hypothetical protein